MTAADGAGDEQLVDERRAHRERVEAEWRLMARVRAAEIGPINAGDPHPRRR